MTFPINPTIGQQHTKGTQTYEWNGVAWDIAGSTTADAIADKADITYVDNKPSGFKNYIINGGFDVWQRGTSSTNTNFAYQTADRWLGNGSGASGTISQVAFGNMYGISFEGTTSNNNTGFIQKIENYKPLLGKTVTLSFYAKSSNGTVVTPTFKVDGLSEVDQTSIALTTSWTRYSVTFTIADNVGSNTWMWVAFLNRADSVTNMQIAQVQLEEGSVATPFEQRPYGLELSLCQRYYYKKYTNTVYGAVGKLNHKIDYIPHPVEMRITPTQSIISSAVANGTTYLSVVDNEGTRIGVLSGSGGTSYNITYEADSEL